VLRVITVDAGFGGTINELRLFYSPQLIGSTTTWIDVWAAGGMYIEQDVDNRVDVEQLKREIDRVVVIDLGPYDAALSWDDPYAEGVRPYRLVWTDGNHDWTLVAGFDKPESAVAVARSIYCG
jgi:hypothetical protein